MSAELRSTSLKNDGLCPICHSDRIRSGASAQGKAGIRGSNRLPINATMSVALDNYVCLDCGYVESYITDRGILNRIAKEWPRVLPPADDNT